MPRAAVVALVVLALMAAAARSQDTICEKYSVALGITQAELMNITISEVVASVALCESCPTVGWFNGSYFPTNFLADEAALTQLIAHLMGFFGKAVGCNSQAFTNAYSAFATNMQAVHSQFNRSINKAAFEFFNEQVINVLASHGVTPDDLSLVSMVLDGFRSAKTGALPNNSICQDADCTSSPFSIKVASNYFNPSYVTIPKNTALVFSKYDLSPHIVTESNSSDECTGVANPAFELDLTGASAPQETDPISRDLIFVDIVNCNSTSAMTGQIKLTDAPASSAAALSISTLIVTFAAVSILL